MIPRDIIVDLDAVTYNANKLASHEMPDDVNKVTGTADEDWAVDFHDWLTQAASLLNYHTGLVRALVVQNADALSNAATTLEDQDKVSATQAEAASGTVTKTAGTDGADTSPSTASGSSNTASGSTTVTGSSDGGL